MNFPPSTKPVSLMCSRWIACRTPWEYSTRPMLVMEPPIIISTLREEVGRFGGRKGV